MTADQDRASGAREFLSDARCVLFDFDGPICRLFPRGLVAPRGRRTPVPADEVVSRLGASGPGVRGPGSA